MQMAPHRGINALNPVLKYLGAHGPNANAGPQGQHMGPALATRVILSLPLGGMDESVTLPCTR